MSDKSNPTDEKDSKLTLWFSSALRKHDEWSPRNWSRTFLVRLVTTIALLISAAVCATLTYYMLDYQEQTTYEVQYDALVDQASEGVTFYMESKFHSGRVLADTIGAVHADTAVWPYVSLPGYSNIAQHLLELSASRAIAFAPIVEGDERISFEEFAVQTFANDPSVPDGVGANGIFKLTSDGWEPDMDGTTSYGSPNDFLVPLFQIGQRDYSDRSAILLNLHSEPTRGRAIDVSYACSQESVADGHDGVEKCSVMTDFLNLVSEEQDVSTLVMQASFCLLNN